LFLYEVRRLNAAKQDIHFCSLIFLSLLHFSLFSFYTYILLIFIAISIIWEYNNFEIYCAVSTMTFGGEDSCLLMINYQY